MLGRAEAVVDVSVVTQLQFQQSFVDYVEVPQLQFIDRVVGISVASQRQGSQCTLCRRRRIRQVQFLDRFGHARCCATTGPDGPDSSVWKCRRCSSCGWTRLVAVKGFSAHFASFFALSPVVPELRASFCSWGALDDEEFFVIEGSGVALTPGVVLPGVKPLVVHEISS